MYTLVFCPCVKNSMFSKLNISVTKLVTKFRTGPQGDHGKFMHLLQNIRRVSEGEPTPLCRLASFIDWRIYPRTYSQAKDSSVDNFIRDKIYRNIFFSKESKISRYLASLLYVIRFRMVYFRIHVCRITMMSLSLNRTKLCKISQSENHRGCMTLVSAETRTQKREMSQRLLSSLVIVIDSQSWYLRQVKIFLSEDSSKTKMSAKKD